MSSIHQCRRKGVLCVRFSWNEMHFVRLIVSVMLFTVRKPASLGWFVIFLHLQYCLFRSTFPKCRTSFSKQASHLLKASAATRRSCYLDVSAVCFRVLSFSSCKERGVFTQTLCWKFPTNNYRKDSNLIILGASFVSYILLLQKTRAIWFCAHSLHTRLRLYMH